MTAVINDPVRRMDMRCGKEHPQVPSDAMDVGSSPTRVSIHVAGGVVAYGKGLVAGWVQIP